MITTFFIQTGTGFVGWVTSLWPAGWTVPSWATGVMTTFDAIFTNVANLGAWVPFGVLFAVVAAVIGVWGIGFGAKALRWLVSWVPFMGG
jgi:hypothetical protein